MAEHTLPPSLIPDSDEPFTDDKYLMPELERMEWNELRRIAAEVESDEINGKSDREEIEAFLQGHERV